MGWDHPPPSFLRIQRSAVLLCGVASLRLGSKRRSLIVHPSLSPNTNFLVRTISSGRIGVFGRRLVPETTLTSLLTGDPLTINFSRGVPGLVTPSGPVPSFCCKMLDRNTSLG